MIVKLSCEQYGRYRHRMIVKLYGALWFYIRALNDVPKGAFLCVYAGNLLTDATANLVRYIIIIIIISQPL